MRRNLRLSLAKTGGARVLVGAIKSNEIEQSLRSTSPVKIRLPVCLHEFAPTETQIGLPSPQLVVIRRSIPSEEHQRGEKWRMPSPVALEVLVHCFNRAAPTIYLEVREITCYEEGA